jgi:MFS family permease
MHRNIRLLTWFNFCNDFRVYNAVAVVYFEQVTHSWALAGLVLAIAKIASAVFDLPTGVLSDMLNRKATLVLGQIASVAAVVSYALSGSFALLALGAVLEGLSFALFSGNNDALLFETLKAEDRAAEFPEYQGRLSAMFQFALATSALVATLVLLAHLPFRALFWISVIPQLLGAVLALGLVEPLRPAGIETKMGQHLCDAIAAFRGDARLRMMSLASIIGFGLGEAKFLTLPAFFALFWPAWALGLGRLLSHALAGMGFRLAGRVVGKWGAPTVLIAGTPVVSALGISAVLAANGVSPALYASGSLLFGPAKVAQASLMQQSFTDRQRATMASLVSFAGALFMAVVVFLLGVLADRIGVRYALLTVEILSISVPYLYWRLFGRHRAERNDVEDQASQG